MHRAAIYKRCHKVRTGPEHEVSYYAHTAVNADGTPHPEPAKWQLLSTHLRKVAALAKEFAHPLNLEAEAELAGLLHDLGKYAERFQARLRNPIVHGINHWAAGARKAAELKGALLDYAIDGHHTGLPAFGELRQTLQKLGDPCQGRELTGCAEPVAELFERFEADGLQLPQTPARHQEPPFAAALRARMLFSCLVDADFLDTEQHFYAEAASQRRVPSLQADVALRILLAHLHAKPAEGSVNQLRRRLLTDCLAAAQGGPGLFTLTAPTGSGKTLASLAFALQHITHHNRAFATNDPRCFRRVIVVIPYTSIIEQTARVYRELFEESLGSDYVLEHHSAVAPRELKKKRGRDA